MKDGKTIKALTLAHANALTMCDALDSISKQFSHPTLQKERRDAAKQHRAFARGCYIAISEIDDQHTHDAAAMVKHLKWLADKHECMGYDERLEEHPETATRHFGIANGLRYAVELLAEENGISLEDPREQYNDPLPKGGEE